MCCNELDFFFKVGQLKAFNKQCPFSQILTQKKRKNWSELDRGQKHVKTHHNKNSNLCCFRM